MVIMFLTMTKLASGIKYSDGGENGAVYNHIGFRIQLVYSDDGDGNGVDYNQIGSEKLQ